jgi:hypothetical protein
MARALAICVFMVAGIDSASAASCDWATAKADIDTVLDGDARKAAEFRALIARGRDSETAVQSLVSADAKPRLRDCGYEAGEYLTKRGFPPLH